MNGHPHTKKCVSHKGLQCDCAIVDYTVTVPLLKMQLEKLTGKMVSFRDRAKYNASQARLQRNRRKSK